MSDPAMPAWLSEHRKLQPYTVYDGPQVDPYRAKAVIGIDPATDSTGIVMVETDGLVHIATTAFNNHQRNTGTHVSPFDTGRVRVGVDGLEVRLTQGVDMDSLKQVVQRAKLATIGLPRPTTPGPMSEYMSVSDEDWQEMFRGGLQGALESQTLVFEIWGASRILTHQLVRTTRARFHQQSQRSTWYGDRPEVRMPETVWRAPASVRTHWMRAYMAAWEAYQAACEEGVPYEDARYILPEGTVNYIQCEYTIREFMNVFAYRGCEMFLREMVESMRMMRTLLVEQCPDLEPFVKVSCEKGAGCITCKGTGKIDQAQDTVPITFKKAPCIMCHGTGGRKCTFQGWENVELACSKPQAKENNRVFLATPKLRIASR